MPENPNELTPARRGCPSAQGVFVVGTDNKVTFRPVKVGIAGDRHFEVLSGLKSGERIVGGTYRLDYGFMNSRC